jgi:hypothetical protein
MGVNKQALSLGGKRNSKLLLQTPCTERLVFIGVRKKKEGNELMFCVLEELGV